MRSSLTRVAIACLASLALASSASAVTIVQFSQQTSTDFVRATVSGTTTTLNTVGPGGSPSIPIVLSVLGTAVIPPGTPPPTGFETFSGFAAQPNATSPAPIVAGGLTSPNGLTGYTGVITLSTGVNGTGAIFLQAIFSNGTFAGNSGASSGGLSASNPPNNVTFFTQNPFVIAALGFPPAPSLTFSDDAAALALAFSNILPPLSITGNLVNGATFQNTGTFSATPIPEPTSVVMASVSVLAGLGYFGWSRRKASQV
jgi:hypothetical protein